MNNAELIAELRGHIREVPLTLLHDAADALEAADEKIKKLENPKAYIAIDFKGDYVLCQANYVYSDGTRLSSEIAKVRIPLEDDEHGMSFGNNVVIAAEKRIAELEALVPKEGEWIMDENPHDGDCRCSACLVAIDAMHERNHGLLNALTGGKWWKFYRYCPNCGARMETVTDCHTLEDGER